ncbi:MAG: hypothetical protein J6Y03_02860 [Alphaproteobacteria bacterium]|nr:hypothetical protein [Alphaproteobacteria bacterium]
MIKQVLCSVLALSLMACEFRTSPSIDGTRKLTTEPTVTRKIAMDCSTCDEDYLADYFIKGDTNSRYSIDYYVPYRGSSEEGWKFWTMLPWNVASILTLFTVIPAYGGPHTFTVNPTLHDHETGRMMILSPIDMSYGDWFGGLATSWLFGPFMYVENDYIDDNPALFIEMDKWFARTREKASESALKEAALAIYNPTSPDVITKWQCETYACRFGEIKAQKTTTAKDVLYVAEKGQTFEDFMYAKNKLAKPMNNSENCEATLFLIKNQTVSKKTQRYWAMIDFFKDNCPVTTIGEYGMSKERLIDKKGIPSKGYFMNDDTEIISYSSLSANGESVNTRTYTLDRDIVTSIK